MSLSDHDVEPRAALASSFWAHSDAGGEVCHADSGGHSQVVIFEGGRGHRSIQVSKEVRGILYSSRNAVWISRSHVDWQPNLHVWILIMCKESVAPKVPAFLRVDCAHSDRFTCTQKCRFMGKEVREISRFFVAPPHVFAPALCAASRTSLPRNTSTLVLLIRRHL